MIFNNIDKISIYVIKSSGQTYSSPVVETQSGCVPNMNKEHIDHEGDDSDVRDSSDCEDIMDYPPDIQPITDLIEWRLDPREMSS